MVFIDVFKNKISIENTKGVYFSYFNKCIDLKYGYYGDRVFTYLIYNKNGYQYMCSPFNETYYNIFKNNYLQKKRRLNIININYIIIYYSYFIYIKYYSFSNIKVYININNSITSKKLFNCRDYYKIYSYIISMII